MLDSIRNRLTTAPSEDDPSFMVAVDEPGDSPVRSEPKQVFLPIQSENTLLLIMGALGIGLLVSIFCILFLLFNNRALATKRSIYVQQTDGSTIKASEFDAIHREADVIKSTAVRWMQMTFEWDNQIPGSEAEDPGYEIEGTTQSVPTEVYLASYLMEPGFREEFIRLMAERISPAVLQGSEKSVVRFFAISDPRQVGEATWEVDIVATRIERNDRQETAEVPMNRTITLKAIPPVTPLFQGLEPSAWRSEIYKLLNNGLLITEVAPLEVN